MFGRLTDFRKREVINIIDGSRLGFVRDVEIDKEGKIKSIIIPGPSGILGILNRNNDFVIPYENIRTIGEDLILVEFEMPYNSAPKRKNFFEI